MSAMFSLFPRSPLFSRLRLRRLTQSLPLTLGLLGTVHAATVQQFQPQGQTRETSRATVAFSADMVALGQTNADAPFTVNCAGGKGAVKGTGRWADTKHWVWQLERPLQPGERCEFTLKPGLKASNGEAITGTNRYAFAPALPRVWQIYPGNKSQIAEDQAFIITTGSPVSTTNLGKNLWCEVEGIGQRIPAQLVGKAEREQILQNHGHSENEAQLVVSCSQALAANSKMRLVWGKGMQAADGTPLNQEEAFSYTVREPFKASMSCERERADAPCTPLSPINLSFNASIDAKLASKFRLVTPEGKRAPSNPNTGSDRASMVDGITFPGPLPQNAELSIEIPSGVKDDAGRALSNADKFPLRFRTGKLPPLAKFPGSFGIVELKEGGILPVTLRNVEPSLATANLRVPGSHRFAEQVLTQDGEVLAAIAALEKFEQQSKEITIERDGVQEKVTDFYYPRELSFLAERSGVNRQNLPKPGGSDLFEVVGIPLTKPGFHIVEIESRQLGAALLSSPKPMYVRTTVLVTNMGVHLKVGKDNALVWVTALDTGKPVSGATVQISNCKGQSLWHGQTDAQGRALVKQALNKNDCFLFASARLKTDQYEDYSFVRSDWNEGIEPWRFGMNTWEDEEKLKFHSVLDRSLFRLGQTVSMKHFVRERRGNFFVVPPVEELPTQLVITHRDTGSEFTQAVQWDKQGAAISQWKIPDSAKLGDYEISLRGGKQGDKISGEFRVSDFRLPVFTGSVQGVPARQVGVQKIPLALGLSFLNGGAAKNVDVQVSATLSERWVNFEKYNEYAFGLSLGEGESKAFGLDQTGQEEKLVLNNQTIKLDKAGAGKLEVNLPNVPSVPSELRAEMSFPDPNGEIQTIRGRVELWPASVVLGLKVNDWAGEEGGSSRIQAIVLDVHGKPIADQAIVLKGQRRIDYSHRRRIVGGFYAYENHEEFVDLGELCSGKTNAQGVLNCSPKTQKEAGNVIVVAEAKDKQGNISRSSASYWVNGDDDTWFTAGNQDRIDVLPEQPSYKAGDTARFQVRTPFRDATALITVEAEGILESFVQPLSRFNPVVEVPIKGEWGPNAFVSVLVVRGRLEPLTWQSFFAWGWREPIAWFKEWWNPVQATAMVDLAKPSYRLGIAEVAIGTESFQLNVEVSTDKSDYRPREDATVKVKVTTPDGKPAPAGTELTFAAVDQALLELRPNNTWDMLPAMMSPRAYLVETATAQSQVIGKRHFGKKAVPAGGGGGRAPARELFDTLLAWYPSIKLDANGTATFGLKLNDSLSEFKLVGVSTVGTSLFGVGSTSIRTKQDLQLISGLPPVVREGDKYKATLTLRNGTAKAMNVSVTAKAGEQALAKQQLSLEAEGAAEVAWTLQAPEGIASLPWEIAAVADTGQQDVLKVTQQIAPAVPLTVQQSTLLQLTAPYEVAATPVPGSLPNKGGIEIGLTPRLAVPPIGLQRYFNNYPFACLEQKTSIAVGLHDAAKWKLISDALPSYLDGNGLARYFPGNDAGYVALTAYVLEMSQLAGFALPEESRRKMQQGLAAFVEGKIENKTWAPAYASNDLLLRKLSAIQVLSRLGETPPQLLTRAAAALDLGDLLRLPTSALIDAYLINKRLTGMPQREARLASLSQEIRNRLTFTNNRVSFTTESGDYAWWLMINSNLNLFRLIEATLDDPAWKDDLPRLLQGAMQRQRAGHWDTTTANTWARVTLDRFAQKFERDVVSGTTVATLGKANAARQWQGNDAADSTSMTNTTPLNLTWAAAATTNGKLALRHEGKGKPWATVNVLAAVPVTESKAMGYRVSRKVVPLQEKTPGAVSRGDLWRVTLTIDADQDMTWVAVSDPIPSGARILGDGDGRDSDIATQGQRNQGWWPSFIERTFSFYRAYYHFLPKGRSVLEYTLRLNNSGEFTLPATRVEAMYAPEIFGEAPNAKVSIKE